MRKLRRITEATVIAEFLKNEFYQEEFHRDRANFEQLVLEANITDETENALRRALLFRRRGHMWRELPADTQWWEVEFDPTDLNLVRVFPRAQWRRISNGSFLIRDIVHRIRTVRFSGRTSDFITKVLALSYRIRNEKDNSSILLIGLDEQHPFTVLEGNHRLTAALLASHGHIENRFRLYCGFSPAMTECCWYDTNLANLWRYARNRLRNLFFDRDADISRVVNDAFQVRSSPSVDVSSSKAVPGSPGSKSA